MFNFLSHADSRGHRSVPERLGCFLYFNEGIFGLWEYVSFAKTILMTTQNTIIIWEKRKDKPILGTNYKLHHHHRSVFCDRDGVVCDCWSSELYFIMFLYSFSYFYNHHPILPSSQRQKAERWQDDGEDGWMVKRQYEKEGYRKIGFLFSSYFCAFKIWRQKPTLSSISILFLFWDLQYLIKYKSQKRGWKRKE